MVGAFGRVAWQGGVDADGRVGDCAFDGRLLDAALAVDLGFAETAELGRSCARSSFRLIVADFLAAKLYVLLFFAVVILGLFALYETRLSKCPIMPPRLLKERTIVAGSLLCFFHFLCQLIYGALSLGFEVASRDDADVVRRELLYELPSSRPLQYGQGRFVHCRVVHLYGLHLGARLRLARQVVLSLQDLGRAYAPFYCRHR